jgi:hypothetical protein
MHIWTVTSGSRRYPSTIIGAGDTAEHAGRQLLAAAAALIGRADVDERPHYTFHLGGQLVAIVQTGDDEFGLPDHAGAADLLGRMQQTRIPFGS